MKIVDEEKHGNDKLFFKFYAKIAAESEIKEDDDEF
jgi:hypothetical protein